MEESKAPEHNTLDTENEPEKIGPEIPQDETDIHNAENPVEVFGGSIVAGFDPRTHQTDENGLPVFKADGTLKRKPGRPRKDANVSRETSPEPPPGESAPAARPAQSASEKKAIKVSSAELARQILMMTTGALSASIGPEWEFANKEEQEGIHAALTEYLAAQGMTRLSPETMLLLAVAGYALPRFAHANTRGFFGRLFDRIVGAFKRGARA